MKTYCKGLAVDRELVGRAYAAWSAAGAGRKNAWRVGAEHGSADALVDEIAREVAGRCLSLAPIRRYERMEPTNGKVRTIGIESVKQQVCDYAAVEALRPMLDAKVGFWQVSSTPGKDQLTAARAVRRWSRSCSYWVHADVRKCYPSVSHDVVMRILRRYVRSPDVLYLCGALLGTYTGGGLEIGSYFSLRMAQLVLSFGYHHVEGLHKTRRGKRRPLVAHQLWYMDDVILMGDDKRDLRSAVRSLERYLHGELGLDLKPWKVCRVGDDEPVDVAGYSVRPGRTVLRAPLFLRARRSFRASKRRPSSAKAARRACSYWGWVKNADCRGFVDREGVAATVANARAVVSADDRKRGNHGRVQHIRN